MELHRRQGRARARGLGLDEVHEPDAFAKHRVSIVLCDACHSGPERYTAASLVVVHVGKSGPFFVRVRRHNTLPVAALVLPNVPKGAR